MTAAISVAAPRGRRGGRLRLDRQHVGVDGGVRREGRPQPARAGARGQDRGRQDGAGDRARRAGSSWSAATSTTACGSRAGSPEHYPVALVNSVNPVRLEGQKTAAFEIVDFLGDAPDVHVLPVGNAGNISAYWLGYRQYADLGRATRRPVMRGFQAAGAAPLVLGEPVADPETRATAIRVGNPASWTLAVAAARRVGRPLRLGHRRPDPRRPARARAPRRRLRRARVGRRRRRAAAGPRAGRVLRRARASSSPSPATASRTPPPRSRASAGWSTPSSTPTSTRRPAAAGLAWHGA